MLTCRPEFTPPWSPRSYLTQLTLSRLSRSHVESMVEKVVGEKALPSEVLQQIVAKTDGVPLFVEELTKGVVETVGAHDRTPLPSFAIPATLHDALMARLDRLAPIREIAQLGATLGREFSYELLHAVFPLDEETLQQGLRQLVEAELLFQRGLPPQTTYIFKHALVQDAAYQSLLKSKRQQCHQQIARVLDEHFPETKEAQPDLLAHHYTEAGLIAQAIPYWQRAGEHATQRSAYVEAISHLTKELELLKTLPDTPEHAQQELILQIALGPALMATKGSAAPEVEKAYARAQELCRQVRETPQLFPVLFGLWRFYTNRAELQTARELGEHLSSLAQRVQDPALLVAAHRVLGSTLYWMGEFAPAREHLEQGLALYDPKQHRSHAFLYGQDPGVFCRIYGALALWHLGYPDQALKRNHEALTLARELSHPQSLALALHSAAQVHQFRREGQLTQERAEAVITLCTAQGFGQALAQGIIDQGWALAEGGRMEEGIEQIRQGLTALQATAAEMLRLWYLAVLAETYGRMGQVEEGLAVLAEALAFVDKTGGRVNEAELYRLKGELTFAQKSRRVGNAHQSVSNAEAVTVGCAHPTEESEAEACFLKAIDVARKQQAKSLELRASTSLARLWQQQGRQKEGHELLSVIYNWFTEGFDTKDLQEAKMLLDELG